MILMSNAMMGAAGHVASGAASSAYVVDTKYSSGLIAATGRTLTVDLGEVAADRHYYIVSANLCEGAEPAISATLDGQPLTLMASNYYNAAVNSWGLLINFWEGENSTSTLASFILNFGWRNSIGPLVSVVRSDNKLTLVDQSQGSGNSLLDLSLNTNGGIIMAAGINQNGAQISWSGADEEVGLDLNTNEWASTAFNFSPAVASPYALSMNASSGFTQQAAAAISLA